MRAPGTFAWLAAFAAAAFLTAPAPAAAQVRLRDIAHVEGVRGNQLVGYGLVMGLQGTGDQLRNTPFTQQSLAGMLERLGISITDQRVQTRNVAAVMVTATLPPFARQGTPIDIVVSSMGDARSLSGGTLVATPMHAADGEVYAVAQGPVVIGGFEAAGQAQSVTQGVRTTGRIPGGGLVEREVAGGFGSTDKIRLSLRSPSFTTAMRVEEAVNSRLGGGSARALDSATVELQVPASFNQRLPAFLAQVEAIQIRPDTHARVVVDERTGTIVVGADVKIDTVAIQHGNLTVRITENPQVSQPGPLSQGQTVVTPQTQVEVDDGRGRRLGIVERNATLKDLVDGLNALGLGPRDVISVLNALKASGALHAELTFI